MQPVDLQRLIQIIVEEVAAAQSGAGAVALRLSCAARTSAVRTGCEACSMQAPPGSVSTPPEVRLAMSRR